MRRLFLRLRRRRSMERDVEAELAFHRDMAAAQGNPTPMGNTTVVKEQARDLWRFTFFENLWRDVVYGVRSLRRSPALVLTALLSLGLGIGINTAIFSLAVEFLFSQPSVTNPGSVVLLILGGNSHANPEVVDFVRSSGLFQAVVGENEETFINWNDGAETRQIFAVQLTTNYLSALGVPIADGRGILPQDTDEAVVLSNRFWRSHLRGDPAVVGRAIRLDGRPYTVVGILPADYRSLIGLGFSPDVYVPPYIEGTRLAIYARLRPGATIGEARAGLLTVARRLDQLMPGPFPYARECRIAAVGGLDRLRSETGEEGSQILGLFFLVLQVVVGLVLLIACLNVASLLLARGSARRRELATRLSLGAGRGRLFQQLFSESLLLSLMGTVLGLALRQALAAALDRFRPPLPLPIHLHLTMDFRITVYAILLTSFAAIASGLLPAWRSIRQTISPDLRPESKLRMQRVMVVAQIALSLVVLTAAFLFLRNLWRSNAISPGFDVRHTLRADVNLPPAAYKDDLRKRAYVALSLQALAGLEFRRPQLPALFHLPITPATAANLP
jgi:putative ABC transport system permease protein